MSGKLRTKLQNSFSGSRGESHMPYLVVVVIVAVVAVVSLVLNSNSGLEGAVAAGYNVPEEQRVSQCTDSDRGNDLFDRGRVQVGVVVKEDFCSGDTLHQWDCEITGRAEQVRPQRCEFGCENGACLRQPTYS